MSDKATKLSGADIDAALVNIQKSVEDGVVLEKGMTVDKRAMGGATTNEDEKSSTDVGREQKNVKNPELGRLPQSNLKGNFATKYKGGRGLKDAEAENAKNPSPNRGLSKAVEKEDEKSSKFSDEKMEKAFPEDLKKDEKKDEKEEKVEKGCDASSMKKGDVAPSQESSASSGSESGSARLGKVVNKSLKAVDLIASAQKHLTKAFEDGSDSDLDKTGQRLIEAKEALLKSIEGGEKVSEDTITSLDKAARYFGKALETYEKEDAEGHVKAVNKTQKHMTKAIEAYQAFEKSLEAAPVKEEARPSPLKFVKQGSKVVLEMTEDEAKAVRKSLEKDNLYKSVNTELPEEVTKAIDATPMLKSIFAKMTESNDSLRDAIVDKSEKDRDFRKSVTEALQVLGTSVKQVLGDVETLKGTPNMRKSIVSVVESPKDETKETAPVDRRAIEATLEKGLSKNLIDVQTFLAWDVDKNLPEVPEKYIQICKSIEARIK